MTFAARIKHVTLLALMMGNADGFAVRTRRQRTGVSSAVFYRTDDESVVKRIQPEDIASSLVTNPLLSKKRRKRSNATSQHLPTWLRAPRSNMVEQHMNDLREAMLASFHTESEALKIMFAIEEAAQGDRKLMSGAAEFCLILVETMEMGLNALIAAAFHYCSCVAARERAFNSTEDDDLQVWDHDEHGSIRMFGDHSVDIARDAARLKKLEMVFGSIVHNPSSQKRLSLDSKDADNLRKLLLTDTTDWRALAIRSAACLFRLRGIEKAKPERLTSEAVRASREALFIFAPLASRLGMHRLKNELEGAAFRTLYRRQYETVTSLSQQMRYKSLNTGMTRKELLKSDKRSSLNICESMKCVLETVQHEMEEVLKNDPVFSSTTENVRVSARVKEPYSLWRKMLRNGSDHVLDVPDALALRIVLNAKKMSPGEPDEVTQARERALCYYVQQLCTLNWAPQDGNPRFKDYVENPKPNGYQSLHYTASTSWQDEDWTLEIQIRSGEMHKVAEYGLASHWDYKSKSIAMREEEEKASFRSKIYSSDSYLRSLQDWHWEQKSGSIQWDASPASSEPEILIDDEARKDRVNRIRERRQRLSPYLRALSKAKLDLARGNVFVFLSNSGDESNTEGNIIALPSDSCVLDAIREHERESGLSFAFKGSPTLNGARASLTQRLRNGDILTVPVKSMSEAASAVLQL